MYEPTQKEVSPTEVATGEEDAIVAESSPQLFNKTFTFGTLETEHLNACVGNNGVVDKRSYSAGFAEAVDILTRAALVDNIDITIDTLIYPICFCARHCLELFLKDQIASIGHMRGTVSSMSMESTHNLANLWTEFKSIASATDRRFTKYTTALEEYVNDFAEIDPTGQTFRYPTDIDSKKHLTKTQLINVASFKKRFSDLANLIREFEFDSDHIAQEYLCKTFTKLLSRFDLEQIAKLLPQRKDWDSADFSNARVLIMSSFGISSRDFQKALDIIQQHPRFCSHIGMHIPIKGLSKVALDRLNEAFNDEEKFSEFLPEEIIGLQTVFEMGLPDMYCELHDTIFRQFEAEFDTRLPPKYLLYRWAKKQDRLHEGFLNLGQKDLAIYLKANVNPLPYLSKIR